MQINNYARARIFVGEKALSNPRYYSYIGYLIRKNVVISEKMAQGVHAI